MIASAIVRPHRYSKLEAGQELSTLDPQTDSRGVGRVNSATQDRQKQ